MILRVLLLTLLPMCLAQFSIQGPSDGNRRAQGLKYSEEKGIEYTEQNESPGVGDFTIQGATDGNSNFRIQGATDGHSNFQIQGPSDGGAAKFNIQGATDGHSQSIIQGPYDPNQGPGKSLQYNDPSGYRVNWRSYDRRQPAPAQPQPQYVEPVAPIRHQAAAPQRQHAQRLKAPQSQPQPQAVSQPIYRSYENAPPQIKQLLQFQAQIPYQNVIPAPFRYDSIEQGQAQQHQQQQQYQREQGRPSDPPYRSKPRAPSRPRRQAPGQQAQQQQHGAAGQQYRRIPQPPADPPVHYSANVPSKIQNILKYQSEIPYLNIIPEQYRFNEAAAVQAQAEQVRAHYQELARQAQAAPAPRPQPPPQAAPQSAHRRQKRQAQQQHRAQNQQPQYQRLSQPPAEPQPQYSTNLPSSIQQLLKYQAQIPYNIIANQIVYHPDKAYVPQRVEAPSSGHAQVPLPPPPAPAPAPRPAPAHAGNEYQPVYQSNSPLYRNPQHLQSDAYQAPSSAYTQAHFSPESQNQYNQYAQYQHAQSGYGNSGVRPVTENQY